MRVLVLSGLVSLAGCLPVTAQFSAPSRFEAGGPPATVAAGDVNGDGKLDLVVTRVESETSGGNAVTDGSHVRANHGTLAVMLGHGDGTFTEAFNTVGAGLPTHCSLADLNGDGKLDIVTTGLAGSGFISVLLGKGDGTFLAPVSIPAGRSLSSVRVADFNADGKMDLLALDREANPEYQTSKIALLLGHGDGTFDAPISQQAGRAAEGISIGDWNGDQRLDVAVADRRDLCVLFLYGTNDGHFVEGGKLPVPFAPVGVAGADINKDGKLDLNVGSVQGSMIYLGDGAGGFSHVANYFDDFTRSAFFGDFDNDGKLDFVTARRLFHGDGTGHFTAYTLPQNEYDDSFVVAADVNGDGWLDVVAADSAHDRIQVYMNQRGAQPPLRASR